MMLHLILTIKSGGFAIKGMNRQHVLQTEIKEKAVLIVQVKLYAMITTFLL